MSGAAREVYRFVFDMKTGRPCSLIWQQEHDCDLAVAKFFAAQDCQVTKPVLPNIIVGTAGDWHRQGLQQIRMRRAADRRRKR